MKTKTQISISPTGEEFKLPTPADYKREFARLQRLAAAQRKQGRETQSHRSRCFSYFAQSFADLQNAAEENGTSGSRYQISAESYSAGKDVAHGGDSRPEP